MLSAAAIACGQESTNATKEVFVSVDALVAEALQKNPESKFYEAEIAAARAGRRTAGKFPNPELSGSAGQKSVRSGDLRAEGGAHHRNEDQRPAEAGEAAHETAGKRG